MVKLRQWIADCIYPEGKRKRLVYETFVTPDLRERMQRAVEGMTVDADTVITGRVDL